MNKTSVMYKWNKCDFDFFTRNLSNEYDKTQWKLFRWRWWYSSADRKQVVNDLIEQGYQIHEKFSSNFQSPIQSGQLVNGHKSLCHVDRHLFLTVHIIGQDKELTKRLMIYFVY